MGFKSEMLEARDEFIALVKAELLGPGSEVSVRGKFRYHLL